MVGSVHNPDPYMVELRQILAQGRKRVGMLLGAGVPVDIKVDEKGEPFETGDPLIPAVTGMTKSVIEQLDTTSQQEQLSHIRKEIGDDENIESILSRVRSLAEVLGSTKLNGYDGTSYRDLADAICQEIGRIVSVQLPKSHTPFNEIASWIGGTARTHPVEIFTPNYDLLLEEALERARIPFFDGFAGACKPFFDPASVANDELPARWPRVWKIHGSIGWDVGQDGAFIRAGRNTTALIYPENQKYDHTQKLPYTALFDRLRAFLSTPDTLLLTCGFSFSDSHICAVIEEALVANSAASVFACQHGTIENSPGATEIAYRRSKLSVYCSDGAIVNGIKAPWRLGESPSTHWLPVRETFWGTKSGHTTQSFLLGSFSHFARFLALSKSVQ